MTHATYNTYHLGDNLLHLHFLRALAKRYPSHHFTHAAENRHLPQLAEVIFDLPNISLTDLVRPTAEIAINAWRGAEGWWYGQPNRHDFVAVHLAWFRHLAHQMGLESPIQTARDLLFDYQALAPVSAGSLSTLNTQPSTGFSGILVINSPPLSGQFRGYDSDAFDSLIARLHAAGHLVYTTSPSRTPDAICTQDYHATVTGIGRISADKIHTIIGVATGPMWPTFNIWNEHRIKLRVILLDHERIELTPNTVHANSIGLVPEILKDNGLL